MESNGKLSGVDAGRFDDYGGSVDKNQRLSIHEVPPHSAAVVLDTFQSTKCQKQEFSQANSRSQHCLYGAHTPHRSYERVCGEYGHFT